MNEQIEPETVIANEFGLVGRDECMATVWPNESSRPNWRTFERMKAEGVIPYVKFKSLCWYRPEAVMAALMENHTVRRRWKPTA